MDKDFGDIVFRNKRNHRGVILLRLEDWQLDTKINALESLLALKSYHKTLSGQCLRVISTYPCRYESYDATIGISHPIPAETVCNGERDTRRKNKCFNYLAYLIA
jgi:hypothetical protein